MKKIIIILPFTVAIAAFAIYLSTASPFMLWLDAPRLLAAIKTFSIPNPPEPLYTLIAYSFSLLPINGSLIFRMQILNSLIAGISLLLLYRLCFYLICETITKRQKKIRMINVLSIISALFGIITLAFSYEFFQQAQNVENFELIVLMGIIILNIIIVPFNSSKHVFLKLGIIAFLFGIGSGTNPVILSFAPAVLIFMFYQKRHLSLKRFIGLAAVGIIGIILVYMYIPIRAAQHPFLNWGNSVSLTNLIHLALGSGLNVYEPTLGRINGFTGSSVIFMKSIGLYFVMLFKNFTPFLLPFMVLGIIYLYKKNKYIFYLLSFVIATNLIFSGLYYSGNQESWFMMSDLIWAIMASLGYFYLTTETALWSKLKNNTKTYMFLAIILFTICLLPLAFWLKTMQRSKWALTGNYVTNLYQNVKGPAIVIGSSDLFDSTSYGFYYNQGKNKDIIPVTDNQLYLENWYRNNLKASTDIKIPSMSQFKFNLSADYSNFFNQFFSINMPKYHIYLTIPATRDNLFPSGNPGGSLTVASKYTLVPEGMLFEIVPSKSKIKPDLAYFNYHFTNRSFPQKKPYFLEHVYNSELTGMVNEYALSFENLGDYYIKNKNYKKALIYYLKAYKFNPLNDEIVSRLGNYYGITGNSSKAILYFKKAYALNPSNAGYQFNLGIAYQNLGLTSQASKEFDDIIKSQPASTKVYQQAEYELSALTPKPTPRNWQVFKDSSMDIQFAYPSGFYVTHDGLNMALLSNNQSGANQLTFTFSSGHISSTQDLSSYNFIPPFTINGIALVTQKIQVPGFAGLAKTYSDGKNITLVLLLKKNSRLFIIKVFPGNSAESKYFVGILQSINTL